jgi:Contractile injection system tube protein
MGWWDVLFPTALGEAEIRVLSSSAAGRTVSVSFIVKTFKIAKKNEFAAQHVPGLNSEPLQFIRGRSRTLSAVLSFDGRSTDTDVRQLMRDVTGLMNVDRDTHAPPVLSFEWKGRSLQCVLESAVEEFRSVFPDGRPSRGRLHVVLRESRTLAQLEQEIRLE